MGVKCSPQGDPRLLRAPNSAVCMRPFPSRAALTPPTGQLPGRTGLGGLGTALCEPGQPSD